jgi:hypothetical protein
VVSPFRWGTPSILSFMVFNSVWSLLVLAYLFVTPLYYARFFHAAAAALVQWITVIFWFAGAVALASYWGSPSCGGNTYCGSTEAAIAFGFFLWVLFTVLAYFDSMAYLRGGEHSTAAQPKPYAGA